jgi:DNA invertase Pin-like site-specific DNA recombinase
MNKAGRLGVYRTGAALEHNAFRGSAMSRNHSTTSERCVIYCRVSDPGQSTVKEQVRWGRELATSKGWPVAAVVRDEGLSGDDLTRPGLVELEKVFASNHSAGCPVTRLLVHKTNRLSRSDTLDAFAILARLRHVGLRHVVTAERTIDLANRLDRTLYALEQDHTNNPFLQTMAVDVLNGMAEVSQAGFWVGRTPLGYRLERKPGEHGAGKRHRSGRLVIDPETAPIIVELFERYAAGASTTFLAAWLTKRVKPPHAPAWSAQTVRELLLNQTYAGTRIFGRRPRGKHAMMTAKGQAAPTATSGETDAPGVLVLRDAVPAIIGPELFARVQALLTGGRRRGYHKADQPLPLSGLGKCGTCGGPLHAAVQRKGKRPSWHRLICANRHRYGREACPDGSTGFSHDDVLKTIMQLLAETLLEDGAAERMTRLAEERAGESERQTQANRDALLRRLADLDASLSRSQVRLVQVAEDMVGDVEAGIRRLRQQRAEAQAELDRQQEEQTVRSEMDPKRFRLFWERCRDAYAIFQRGPSYPPSLRPLLVELLDGFTVHFRRDKKGQSTPDRVDVELPKWLTLLACNACTT